MGRLVEMSRGRGDVLALGAAAIAVACCAGLPLIATAIGTLTAASLLGIGAGVLVLAAFATRFVIRRRARGGR